MTNEEQTRRKFKPSHLLCSILDLPEETDRGSGLDLFIVSAFDSIYDLTGAGFEPLVRPFFLLVRSHGAISLIVPTLDHEHMKKAYGDLPENIHTYCEYSAPNGRCWSDRLGEPLDEAQTIGVEPTLRQEIVQQISACSLRTEPLVERLRLVKTATEVKMIERAAMYADYGVEMMHRTHEAALSGDRRVKPDMNSHQTQQANVRNKSDADDWRVS